MKTIQQIMEEERANSQLTKVSEGTINRTLANQTKGQDIGFQKNCSIAQQLVWNDPNKNQIKKQILEDTWTNNPDKLINPRKKEIQVPWGRFESRKVAEEQGKKHGIKQVAQTIRNGLENDKNNFFFINKIKKTMPMDARLRMAETKKKNGGKNCLKFKTPFGIIDTQKETLKIMKANGVPNPRHTLPKLLLDPNSGYKKI